MYNYDDDDYCNERDEFIKESQQKVWDLWTERYMRGGRLIDSRTKQYIAWVVQDWTGHSLLIDVGVELPPPTLLPPNPPPDDVSF